MLIFGTGRMYFCKRLVSIDTIRQERKFYGSRLNTKWGQSEPWNRKVPRVPDGGTLKRGSTGCSAVALAQLLYFSHYKFGVPSGLQHGTHFEDNSYELPPKYLLMNYREGNYVQNSPRWNQMILKSNEAERNPEGAEYVAEFMAEVGYRLGMEYKEDGSGADITRGVLRSYGVDCDYGNYKEEIVIDNLKNGLPILVSAYRQKETKRFLFWKFDNYKNGHAWVIDGLVDVKTIYRKNYQWEQVILPNFEDKYNPQDFSGPLNESELYMVYEDYITPDEAVSRNISDYSTEETLGEYTKTMLTMNWGMMAEEMI